MDLRTTYESLSLDVLREYVARKQEENLHLEFKRVSNPDLTSNDKKHLARMMSAFANSAGGLIVWGVDARRIDGIDCASGLHEIEPLGLLLSRLNEFTGPAAEPTLAGVQHRTIEATAGRGFAITLVPESDIGPHMAKFDDDRYYKRAGDRTYRMEHYDIADMFGRRQRPKLELTLRPRTGREIVFGLKNTGRAIARAPYLAISTQPPFRRSPYGIDGNRNEGIQFLVADSPAPPWRYPAKADEVIHPGVTLEIGCLMSANNATPLAPEGVRVTYSIACEGMQLVEGQTLVPTADIN
jgi:hypothetical protein